MDSFSVFRRTLGPSLVTVFALGLLSGCGNAIYAVKVSSAAGKLEQAETVGAEEKAPYEYYSASVRLAEARNLAARAEYGDAWRLAKEAGEYADRAISKAERAGRASSAAAAPAAQPAPAAPPAAQPAPAAPPAPAAQPAPPVDVAPAAGAELGPGQVSP